MLRLGKKIGLFAVPYLVWAACVFAIDPYNYFGFFDWPAYSLKESISRKINSPLWRLIQYRKQPEPRILLGDSRINKLTSKDILAVSGHEYYNFGYGGGTLPEMCDTFWYAAEQTELREVYFCVDLNHFAQSNMRNRVRGARKVQANPLLYIVNRNVLQASFQLVTTSITGNDPELGRPNVSKDEFWQKQLDATTNRYYRYYEESSAAFDDLRQIADYCKTRQIDLVFVIPPTHIDSQELVLQTGVNEPWQQLRHRLADLGPVIDLNVDSAFTRKAENFSDPWHVRQELMRELARQIWSPLDGWGNVYPSSYRDSLETRKLSAEGRVDVLPTM